MNVTTKERILPVVMVGVPEPRESLAQAQARRWEGASRARTRCPSAERIDLLALSVAAEEGGGA